MTWSKIILALLIASAAFNVWSAPTVHAQTDSFTPVFVLLAPQHNDLSTLTQLQATIKTNGGQVTHTFPYQALIAKIPANMTAQLSALPGVAAVFTAAVELSTVDIYGPEARRLAATWNGLISPQAAPATELGAHDHSNDPNDALTAPDLPAGNEIGVAAEDTITPGYYQTSEFMAGSVSVGIVLVESNGLLDPSTEDWTNDEKQLVFSEIVAALNWWAEREPRANLSFVYDDHFSSPLPTRVEPITRPYYDQQYWIADAMGALGFTAPAYFTRVRDYNNHLRAAYHTDWAFTIFVVDSSNDADHRFSDSYFAYAYLGGPFLVMTSGNDGYGPYNMDAVAAHEMGHIFHALDQYYSAYQACTLRSGYLYIENQNSQYGGCASSVNSIMRGQTYPYWAKALDPYAAGQIGWRDSDGDNILDPLDTSLPISIDSASAEGNSITVSGSAQIIPYPSPVYPGVTINTLIGVNYRFDGGDWQPATATDGAFDGTAENYQFTTAALAPGRHNLEVAAVDSAGNASESYATETVTILDPLDGGLNTELYRPINNEISANQAATISGVSYHMQGGIVTNVEYRINDGSWQPARAEDGAFDSDYEPFSLTFAPDSPALGFYRIEARATDNNGYVETNIASQEIKVAKVHLVFLPAIINTK